MSLAPPPLSHMAFSDSPLFKFSTTKDTPPTHGAENKNLDKWIKKSLINSTFHNWLPLKFKAMQKGPKCSSFWQNLCHSKGKLLLCILLLIFFQLSIIVSQSWGGERGFDQIRYWDPLPQPGQVASLNPFSHLTPMCDQDRISP